MAVYKTHARGLECTAQPGNCPVGSEASHKFVDTMIGKRETVDPNSAIAMKVNSASPEAILADEPAFVANQYNPVLVEHRDEFMAAKYRVEEEREKLARMFHAAEAEFGKQIDSVDGDFVGKLEIPDTAAADKSAISRISPERAAQTAEIFRAYTEAGERYRAAAKHTYSREALVSIME